jgi:hypothetical protein
MPELEQGTWCFGLAAQKQETQEGCFVRVLYIASNPHDEVDLDLEQEITDLQSRLIASGATGARFDFLPALTTDQLAARLKALLPSVLHLAAHGARVAGLQKPGWQSSSGDC